MEQRPSYKSSMVRMQREPAKKSNGDHEGKINAKFYAKQFKKQQKDYFQDVVNKK
jgi:hypothetical protein